MPNILDRLLNRQEAKASRASNAIVQRPGQAVWTNRDLASFAREGYAKNPWVYACIQEITKAAKSVPMYLARSDGEPVEDSPLMSVLDRPNEWQGGASLVEAMLGYLLMTGNAYLEKVGPRNGPPRELYALRPDRMRVIPNAKGYPDGFIYKVNHKEVRYRADEVMHTRLWHPTSDWYGLSPMEAAATSVDTHNEGLAWNVALLQNTAAPSGAWITEENLTDDQYHRMRNSLTETVEGARNAGKGLLLEGGVRWEAIGLTAKELDWIEGLDHAATQIASVFGVPGELIGLKPATFENRAEARKTLYTETVLPLMEHFLGDLNNWLVPKFQENVELVFDKDQIEALGEDRDRLWERVHRAWATGILTRDEAREAIGYEPAGDDSYATDLSGPPDDGINTPGEKAVGDDRVMVWKAHRDLQDRWERTAATRVTELFQRERDLVQDVVNSSMNPAGIPDAIQARMDMDAWKAELLAVNVATAEAFGEKTRAGLKAFAALEAKQGPDVFRGYFDETVSFLSSHAAESAKQVSDTTMAEIRNELDAGVQAGESIPNLASRLDDLYLEQIIPNRSTVIARTEVIRASNYGTLQAAKASGLNLRRRWLATKDGRVRPDHDFADGQTVGMNESYLVGGARLAFPGDPAGPASQTIQCRCTETFEVVT